MKFDANSLLKFGSWLLDLLTQSDSGKRPPAGSPPSRPGTGHKPSSGKPSAGKRSPDGRGAGSGQASRPKAGARGVATGAAGWEDGDYPGDYHGPLNPSYSPRNDGNPDPGEIVWAWVPYEEDYSQGKDRPVLLVGRDRDFLLGLMLTSKDHTDATRQDRNYIDIGTGSWDKQGRPSEVKLDRVLRLLPGGIRREGATLKRDRFNAVAAGLAQTR